MGWETYRVAKGAYLMVLVDTTVWIDFFAARNEPHVGKLQEFIESEKDLSLCGVTMTEILQGLRSDTDFLKAADQGDSADQKGC